MSLLPIPRRRAPVGHIDPVPVALPAPGYQSDPGTPMGVPVTITTVPTAPETAANPVPATRIPSRWAVSLVCLVLILAGVLIGVGKPVGIVMETLSASGFLGVELVRRINREL